MQPLLDPRVVARNYAVDIQQHLGGLRIAELALRARDQLRQVGVHAPLFGIQLMVVIGQRLRPDHGLQRVPRLQIKLRQRLHGEQVAADGGIRQIFAR